MTVISDGRPVVIVAGAARAGTAALAAGIAAASGSSVVEAGPAFGLLWTLTAAARDYEAALSTYEAALAPGPVREIEPWLRRTVLKDLFERPDAQAGVVLRAADLLPGAPALRALPLAAAAIPSARCVHLRRDGIDFVQSRMRVLPEVDFAAHCLAWVEDAETWAAVRHRLGRPPVEIDRGRLSAVPDVVASELGALLGWSEEASARFVSAVRARRPGRSGLFAPAAAPSLAEVSWSQAEKEVFAEICGPSMAAAGTPLDRDAALRRQPLRLTECLDAWKGRAVEGCAIARDGREPGGVALTPADGAADGLSLLVPCLSLGSRTRFSYRAAPLDDAMGPMRLRVSLRESLSGREIGEVAETLRQGQPSAATVSLSETGELVDIEIAVTPEVAGSAGLGVRLIEATFRHADPRPGA